MTVTQGGTQTRDLASLTLSLGKLRSQHVAG